LLARSFLWFWLRRRHRGEISQRRGGRPVPERPSAARTGCTSLVRNASCAAASAPAGRSCSIAPTYSITSPGDPGRQPGLRGGRRPAGHYDGPVRVPVNGVRGMPCSPPCGGWRAGQGGAAVGGCCCRSCGRCRGVRFSSIVTRGCPGAEGRGGS